MARWLVVPGSMVSPDIETLRRLYVDEGLSLAAIAGRVGVAAQTVHNWLVAGGVPRRPSPARFRSDIDDGEIIRLYTHEGHTTAEIAEQLGCSTSLVYGRLARRGVDRRPPGPSPTTWFDRTGARPPVPGLWAEPARSRGALRGDHPGGARRGWSRRTSTGGLVGSIGSIVMVASWSRCMEPGGRRPAIADHVGCSPSTVYRRLDAAGIARRPARPALSREDLIKGLERVWSAPQLAAARPCGQRVVRGPSPRPRASHDHRPGHQTTDESPLPRVLRQSRPVTRQTSA